MNDQLEDHLTARMREAVDARHIDTPDLLPRARAARGRHRLASVGVLGALGAAGALALTALQPTVLATPIPADPTSSSTTSAATGDAMSANDATATTKRSMAIPPQDGGDYRATNISSP